MRARGVTLAELLTALVVLAVLAAIAIPLWRNHLMRVRRMDAISALVDLQTAQDNFFGQHARYASSAALGAAPPDGLGLKARSPRDFYTIELHTAADGLSYTADASPNPHAGEAADTRCAHLSINHLGIRRATDDAGTDRSADCWR